MITAVIAEKPSVAKDIANVLNVRERHDGYLSGNGYLVTWAFGHLVQLAMPEAYGYTGFRRENLPILPQEFKYIPRQIREGKEYKPDPGVLKQLKVIKEVFDRSDRIVVATDAGREGEAIHRYIYNYLGCRKPCLRLWISSLTDRAIREGLDNLKPGSDYDNLYRAAEARAIADWEIGLNATQALSIAAGQGIYSLGRVQTPTLMMICSRYLENRDFTPQTYFRLKVTAEKDGTPFAAISELRYETLPAANAALAAVTATGTVQVADVQRREVSQEPPLLYDLTALQKEANGRYGFSADKTLSVAQSLYEKKVLSYPRTGSRYLSDDVFDEIPDRIALLERYPAFATHAAALKGASLNRRSVDAGKVTDHHALIITECLPGELSADERTVYDMVAARLLEAFSARCLKDVTTVSFTAGNSVFTAKGTVIRSAGWRAVRNERDEDDEGTAALPPLQPGEAFLLQSAECVEKQTKPRPLHTESSLLSAMEHCGRELRDDELRDSLKGNGIGTPATRASIIETLFARDYVRREKKSLVPTDKGLAVYQIVKDKRIADVEMTGQAPPPARHPARHLRLVAAYRSGVPGAGRLHRGAPARPPPPLPLLPPVLCPQLRQRIGSRDPPAAPAGRLDRRRQPTGFQGLVPVIPAIIIIFANRTHGKGEECRRSCPIRRVLIEELGTKLNLKDGTLRLFRRSRVFYMIYPQLATIIDIGSNRYINNVLMENAENEQDTGDMKKHKSRALYWNNEKKILTSQVKVLRAI